MRRIKRTQPRDVDLDAMVVAWLRSQRVQVKQIAHLLEVSQPEVSRLIRRAEAKGWLQTRHEIPPEKMPEVQARLFPYERILAKLHALAVQNGVASVRGIRVIDSGAVATDPNGYARRLDRFGRLAAGRLQELLPQIKLLGVTWGRTIASLVQSLRELHVHPPEKRHPIEFVPVCGVLFDDPNIRLSSSTLASELHEIINGNDGEPKPLSLGAVPARIPPEFDARSARKIISQFIAHSGGYHAIFLADNAKVHRIDSILTGVGTAYQRSNDPWLLEMARKEHMKPADLDRLALGDLCGVFLPKPGLGKSDQQLVAHMNERWTGIKLGHFERCAREASSNNQDGGPPGVIILAVGKAKAEVIRECVRRGLVNELIIDNDLANELAAT